MADWSCFVSRFRAHSCNRCALGKIVNHEALQVFAETLRAKFSLPGSLSPEDQLKAPVAELLRLTGATLKVEVDTLTESSLREHKVRPDIAAYRSKLICGYLELKAPGLGADPNDFKDKRNKEQWKRLKALPNLIYTDGREWALFRYGERQGEAVKLSGDPVTMGATAASPEDALAIANLLRLFFFWDPIVPHGVTELARYLAPLTRFLRSEVEAALAQPGSNIEALAAEWRAYFFPSSDNAKFADAYAQTVTYAMLLARLSGAATLDPASAAKTLDSGNRLLARALELLGQPAAKSELRVGFELLQRSLEALKPERVLASKPDIWLTFYEDFLTAYDPKLRRDYGVYYTPRQVVGLQTRLVSQLLESRFEKKLGFADDGVLVLDPAVGTGTYLIAAVNHAIDTVKKRSGPGAVPARAAQMADNMLGFEVLMGPYAVAHLRLSQTLEAAGAKVSDRLKVYLADTLESPNSSPTGGLTLTHRTLTEEHEAARRVKNEGEIVVCIGNPPYDREQRATDDPSKPRKGGWVRYGDLETGGAKLDKAGERAIFDDFLDPVKKIGKGNNLQTIFNDYVYFWRWALWRLFEKQATGGVVSFITASSYLVGPGFVGMREVMRRTFDEIWIIDLGGDNLGARKTPNVFKIQTPVAIAIGVRGKQARTDIPARSWYVKVDRDSRNAKLDALDEIKSFEALDWEECGSGWHDFLMPTGKGNYFDWPPLSQLFPFHTAGAVFYRSWPIGETKEVLQKRWVQLASAAPEGRAALFKESRDRKIGYTVGKPPLPGFGEAALAKVSLESRTPETIRYGFRPFDRQYAFYDFRMGDFLRPALNTLRSDRQLFLIAPDTMIVGEGPAMLATALVPDQHHFRGSFGGRDVFPLYRDPKGTIANLANGLTDLLSAELGQAVSAEDVASYVYAILNNPSYVKKFWDELSTPGLRVPITKDPEVFRVGVSIGKKLIWLHTYCARFGEDERLEISPGEAKITAPIPHEATSYPEAFSYDPDTRVLKVGGGAISPVTPEIWEFSVSGLKVVQSWLKYRMKAGWGKKSSPLDTVRPEQWSPTMTDEILEMIWVLEATIAQQPESDEFLEKVLGGECFKSAALPEPSEIETKSPVPEGEAGELLEMMLDEETDAREED